MNIKKTIFAALTIVLMLSCNRDNHPYKIELDSKHKFVISLDSLTAPSTRMVQFFDDTDYLSNLGFLAMLNYDFQRINIHNEKGIKINEINLSDKIPSLPKISGFSFISPDSLLLFSEISREMRLFSVSNKFPSKILFNLDTIKNSSIGILSSIVHSRTPIFYKNGVIYLTGKALTHELKHSSPPSEKVISAISFDLKENKADFLPVFAEIWDERYWHNEQYYVNHTFLPKQNAIIYSLAMKDSVILYNLLTKDERKISIKGEKLGDQTDMMPPDITDPSTIGTNEDLTEYLNKPHYGQLIFDKFRNVYYRFVSSGFTNEISYLIICDNNFKVIGESKLPDKYVCGGNYFIAQDGLYLRYDQDSDQKDESKIVYSLFKLVKNP